MVNEASKSSKNKMKKNNNNNGGGGSGVSSNSESTLTTMATAGGGGVSSKSKRKSNEYESEKRREMNGNPMSTHDISNLESTNSNDDDDAAITSSSESSNSLITQELETASRDENAYSTMTTRTGTDASNKMSSNIYRQNSKKCTDSSNEQQLQEIDLNLLSDIGDDLHAQQQSYHVAIGPFRSQGQTNIKQQHQQSSTPTSPLLMQQQLNQRTTAKPQHVADLNSIINCSSSSTGPVNGTAGMSQPQMKPQRLDSISLETLDQKICHLILDENELLQVKNQEEFINLFRNSKSSNDLDGSNSETGASLQQPQGLSSLNSSSSNINNTSSSSANSSRKNSSCNLNANLNGGVRGERLFNNSASSASHNLNNHHRHPQNNHQNLTHLHHPCESLLDTLMNGEALNTLSASSFSAVPLQSSAITDDKLVECVAIFGNTGDGKSHTLNHTFFNGRDIFRTSSKQETCTMGVWCAYDPNTKALIFDTEGLLGTSTNENTRMRLLLKVLAISDVVIYRTRAERLHNDLFHFLSEASVAYTKYFKDELKMAQSKLKLDTISSLGPRCIIFHETQHTDVLRDEMDVNGQLRTVSHQLSERFDKLKLCFDAFSSMDYVGTRTFMKSGSLISDNSASMSTDFTKLAQTVRDYLYNNSVRPPRKLSSIYQALKALNEKFSGKMPEGRISTFADEYFTCSSVCLSCNKRCQNSINHLKDGVPHCCSSKCHYDHQYDNKVYVCKQCHEQSGKEVIVIPKTAASNENSLIGIVKYALSGFVLECPHHGIIYRSRQYWYGNQEPESVVRTELKHIWSGQVNNVGTSHNLSRKIIDGVSYLGESLHSVSAKPTKMAMQWMADKVAPTYWTPNSEIVACHACNKSFADLLQKKHHCRGCGKGFCDKCSAKRRIISWWSLNDPVRVCDPCYDKPVIPEPPSLIPTSLSSGSFPSSTGNTIGYGNLYGGISGTMSGVMGNVSHSGSTSGLAALAIGSNNDVMARKVTETVQDTIGLIGYATKIPFTVLKETARPSYWKPDNECTACAICKLEFDDLRPLHHCRSCGDGVCNVCSPKQRPVPSRGWDTPVRVCNTCIADEVVMSQP